VPDGDGQAARNPRRRRLILAAATTAVVAAGAAVAMLLLGGSQDSASGAPAAPSASAPPPDLTAVRAQQLSDGLVSGSESTVRTVLDLPAEQPLDPGAVEALAAMPPATIDLSTFRNIGDGSATVEATTVPTDESPSGHWTLYLIYEDGQWMMSQSVAA
jgi:hypothetical protein